MSYIKQRYISSCGYYMSSKKSFATTANQGIAREKRLTRGRKISGLSPFSGQVGHAWL